MSNFIHKGYFCIDDFFGPHRYGYVKMEDDDITKPFPSNWCSLYETIKQRSVLDEDGILNVFPNFFKNEKTENCGS